MRPTDVMTRADTEIFMRLKSISFALGLVLVAALAAPAAACLRGMP